ncbi:MAG: hypothetical protein QM489_00075 [Candidatus Izemoplasma sp.]
MTEAHECATAFESGKNTVDKVREKGFTNDLMKAAHMIECECGTTFEMKYFEGKCPSCNMVFGVTPCHADDKKNVMAAGINY